MEGNMQQGQAMGTTQIMMWVMKIFGIIGMIFIGISLILPWGAYTIPGTNWGLNLNPWGVSTSIPSGAIAGADSFFSDMFYINTMQAGITAGIVAGICMILVFVFAIITLLISIKAFRGIGTGEKTYLTAGIFTIVTLVLCVIGTTQATTYAIDGEMLDITDQRVVAEVSGGADDTMCEYRCGDDIGYSVWEPLVIGDLPKYGFKG